MTEPTVKFLTCDRCLSGRHSVLCENNGCACNLCAKAKMASPVRKKRKKYARPVPKTRVRTEEERKKNAEAQRRYYREIHEFPAWSYDEDALAVKLGELFTRLQEEKHGS